MNTNYPIADNHNHPVNHELQIQKTYSYCFRFEEEFTEETGEVVAKNRDEALLYLKVQYSASSLPTNLRLWEQEAQDIAENGKNSAKFKYLMHILAEHYKWLDGDGGHRADLHNLNLSGANLSKMNLRHAYLAEADLTGANLTNANLSGVNLMRANLLGANLTNANLTEADLSDADLRDCDLTGADLSGVDMWRANLKGAKIKAKDLHKALSCK